MSGLSEQEREWVALALSDAAAERDTEQAARLIEARIETLIRRRLEPVAEFAHDMIAYEAEHAAGSDTPTLLAIARDLIELVKGR